MAASMKHMRPRLKYFKNNFIDISNSTNCQSRCLFRMICLRHFSLQGHLMNKPHLIQVNHSVSLDPVVKETLVTGKDHRKHPGVINHRSGVLPTALEDAVLKVFELFPVHNMRERSKKLHNYLVSRHLPAENETIQDKANEAEEKVNKKYGLLDVSNMKEEDREQAIKDRKSLILRQMRKNLYKWQPIRYNAEKGLLYTAGRIAEEYSVLYQIFTEISKRDQSFQPHTLFDFGSGVGTVTWAANTVWKNSFYEHVCVDTSDDMHTIARLLLQGGEDKGNPKFKEVYLRKFFPPSYKNTFSLVVSAYSLFELPNRQERLKTILNLWRKTHDYLILVENGTNAGFQVVSEARDFILHLSETEGKEDPSLKGFTYAPCPHDLACPRVDGTPCNFQISNHSISKRALKKSQYCFVVMKKGVKTEESWPRIVRQVTRRSKHVHVKTCGVNGQLESCVITANKHGKELYWCARNCEWGDLLPVQSSQTEQEDQQHNNEEDIRP